MTTRGKRWMMTPYESGTVKQLWKSRSYFGADGKLYLEDRRTCLMDPTCDPTKPPSYADRPAFEEYRYDALGRRIFVRTRTTWNCGVKCEDSYRRVVWDGDQILYEINAHPNNPEADTGHTPNVLREGTQQPANGFFGWGRVAYVHGRGIDDPLAVVRAEYSDSLPGPHVIFPQKNAAGQYDSGTHTSECVVIEDIEMVLPPPGEGEEEPPPGSSYTHCVEVTWPANNQLITGETRREWSGPSTWMGSLVVNGRDATGDMYRRNRYYDPVTGQFTQTDPIGLAGGLNVYGYANGDPHVLGSIRPRRV